MKLKLVYVVSCKRMATSVMPVSFSSEHLLQELARIVTELSASFHGAGFSLKQNCFYLCKMVSGFYNKLHWTAY